MKELWNRFTLWLSGWPEGAKERIQKESEESQSQKAKKPKGLNSKKKKKAKKQGNIS